MIYCARMAVTPTSFKAAKPQFAAVPDGTVQTYIDFALATFVDDAWGDMQDQATILFVCHLMTLDGLGTDPTSQGFATGTAAYQSVKSGQLTVTRFQSTTDGTTFGGWLQESPCGRQYYMLLRMMRGGPRVALGGGGRCVSGYAKDLWRLDSPFWRC